MSPAGRSFTKRVSSAEAELWRAGRPRLTRLDIELTERCNNDCLHCSINLPADDAEALRREWSAGDLRAILEEAVSLGCLSVRFTGGEPLLRDDFEDIYLAARRLGLRVRLFTNATLITPRLAALFGKVPPLESIEVSVYGLTPESSAAVTRNPTAFEAARRGLARLADNGVPFIVKGVLLPQTRDEQDEFRAWAVKASGAAGRPGCAMLFDLRSRRDDEAKNAKIRSLRLAPRDYIDVAARSGDAEKTELARFLGRFAGLTGGRLFPCLSDSASIDACGHFQVCLVLRHPETVYDLRTGSLRQAVVEFLPAVRRKTSTNRAYLDRCGRCFLKSLCLQCPAKSWAEHGTLDTPVEYFCEIAQAQGVWLGVLEEGENPWTVMDWAMRVARLCASFGQTHETPAAGRADCQGE